MIINKDNLDVIDTGDLCLHDLLISSFDLSIQNKSLTIKISDYHEDKLTIKFQNLIEFYFCSINEVITQNKNEIFGWEEIPNKHNQDFFIEDVKNKLISQGRQWNDNLFAVRILLTNTDEFKIVCESICIT